MDCFVSWEFATYKFKRIAITLFFFTLCASLLHSQSIQSTGDSQKDGSSSKNIKTTMERSWVWDHFTTCTVKEVKEIYKEGEKEQVEEMVLKARCNHCEKLFACDSHQGGTSSYGKHIKKLCKKYKPNGYSQPKTLGGSNVVANGDVRNMLEAMACNQEESVRAIMEFIVTDEQPISIVDKEGFRKMMSVVQPRLYVPHPGLVLWRMYGEMREGLRTKMIKSKVSSNMAGEHNS